jgi:aryl-alcohol dehydrogenase-like predicted oxidoreductase
MAAFPQRVSLGRSGLQVSKLGLGSSFKAPTSAYIEAFDRGVNYFYWGSIRRREMGDAIREIASDGRRDGLVCMLQSYSRVGSLLTLFVERGLRSLGLERTDALLLGWHNKAPSRGVLDAALALKERGLVGSIGLSTHHRRLLPTLIDDETFDIWHLRYNAVHRGAEREVFPCLEGRDVTERPGIVTYTTTRWGDLCNSDKMPPGEETPTGTDCYRYALSRPEVDLCLAGPDNPEHMKQALAALDMGPMDQAERDWMERIGRHIYQNSRASSVMDGR